MQTGENMVFEWHCDLAKTSTWSIVPIISWPVLVNSFPLLLLHVTGKVGEFVLPGRWLHWLPSRLKVMGAMFSLSAPVQVQLSPNFVSRTLGHRGRGD